MAPTRSPAGSSGTWRPLTSTATSNGSRRPAPPSSRSPTSPTRTLRAGSLHLRRSRRQLLPARQPDPELMDERHTRVSVLLHEAAETTTGSSAHRWGRRRLGVLVCEVAGHSVGAAGTAGRQAGPQRADLAAGVVGQGVHRAPPRPALGGLLRPGAGPPLQPRLNRQPDRPASSELSVRTVSMRYLRPPARTWKRRHRVKSITVLTSSGRRCIASAHSSTPTRRLMRRSSQAWSASTSAAAAAS
jgi:hypothetical protein